MSDSLFSAKAWKEWVTKNPTMFLFGPSAIQTNFWPLIRSSPFLLGKLFIAQVVSQRMFVYWHISSPDPSNFVTLYFLASFCFSPRKQGWELKQQHPASTCLSYKTAQSWGALHALEGCDMENLELHLHRQAAEVMISSFFTACLRAHQMCSHTWGVSIC